MASIGRNLEIMAAVRMINKRLAAIPAAVENEVVGTMITQAGLIAAEIKRIAPVDPTSDHPGELKESVRVIEGKRTAKKAFSVKVAVGNIKTKDGKAGFNYPRGVEFGTQKNPAHPFFWPIWRLRRKGARQTIRKSAVKAVRKAWGDK
jgi:HK97 gp10 family phage protein